MNQTEDSRRSSGQEKIPEDTAKIPSASEPDSISALVEQYRPLVYSIASRFHGLEFDDLVQEGMLGLWNAARHFDPSQGSSFGAFAALCIQRRMLALAASHRRRREVSFEVLEDDPLSRKDGAPDPEMLLILKEDVAAVQQRIRELLSPLERQILRLYLEGRSYQQIAQELAITPKAVDNGLQRLRRKLKG